MQVGCYSLHMYCDVEGCPDRYNMPPAGAQGRLVVVVERGQVPEMCKRRPIAAAGEN